MAVPVTILPRANKNQQLFQGLGTGLGNVLQGLASGKAKEIQGRRLEESGLPSILAYLDPQTQAAYLKQYGAAQQMAQAQGLQQELADQVASAESGSPEFLQPTPQPNQDFSEKNELEKQTIASEPDLQSTQEIIANAKTPSDEQISREAQMVEGIENLKRKLQDPSTKKALKPQLQKRIDEREAQLEKISSRREKESANFRSEITKNYKNAKDILDVLKRQDELNEKGTFQTAGDLAFLKGIGIEDIDSLKSADLQEFIKHNGIFYRQLKGLFGGRITNQEIDQFRKTIANEYQSPEGRRRVIATLRKAAQGDVVRFKKMNEIIEKNKDIIPSRLEEKLENASKKELKKIRKEWRQSLSKAPLPEAEGKFTTAAKALAGQAIGAIPGALKGAGKGALIGAGIGRAGGPGGIAAGAGLGGLAGLLGIL